MASTTNEVVYELPNFIRVYKDGKFERLSGTDVVPASTDPDTGVQSKDVIISPETGVGARVYIPKTTNPGQKLPLLVYFHGGGFVIETAYSPTYHNYLNSLVAEANVVVASIDYRRAPEHLLPVAYDDSWTGVKWVASHSNGGGDEEWLKEYADFERVYFAGDSAGANLAHNMAIRVGPGGLDGIKLVGIVLVHPYFWGKDPIGSEDISKREFVDKLWVYVNPGTSGSDDPLINPVMDPKFPSLGCAKVLVCVAEKDLLRDRGWNYRESLGKSGWGGVIDIMEAKEEDHVFHLFKPTCENALAMLKKVASFMNEEKA
ncbi:probable carboxylesterase 2 [Cornus florida]|uniref:probable carboxylesterase 2 n=1 Tax=Cornus florida TaxID=4283 RepID=UPI0028A17CB7|nr:probable carboxylesterase 2 [Cornus florida]